MRDTKHDDDRTPNWNKWRLIPDAMLWQCVLLSLKIDPDTVKETPYFISATRPIDPIFKDKEFKDRIDVAVANLYRTLQPTQHSPRREVAKVSLRQFAVWVRVRETGWVAPAELLAMADEHDPGEGRPQCGAGGPKWPWGSHETELLRRGWPGSPGS